MFCLFFFFFLVGVGWGGGGGVGGKKMVDGVLRFVPGLLPVWFFQSSTRCPLKKTWLSIRQNEAPPPPPPGCRPSSCPPSISSSASRPSYATSSPPLFFFFGSFFFSFPFLVIILFHFQFFLFVGTVRCRKGFSLVSICQ